MADVLSMATVGTRKTNIMYKANLSHGQLFNYLEELQKLGLLKQYEEEGKKKYITTERGRVFISHFLQMAEMMNVGPEEAVMRYLPSRPELESADGT